LLISLVGLPGSGKSTIGRRLAKDLGGQFLDADLEVEREAGCSIASIFEQFGEGPFRDIEERVIARLIQSEGDAVIATGGGVILRESNRLVLRDRSTVVYLHCLPDTLVGRLRNDGRRPLLGGGNVADRLRQLFKERDALYRETAHVVVDPRRLQAAAAARLIRSNLQLSVADAGSGAREQRTGREER
jgi:shikimate kinase